MLHEIYGMNAKGPPHCLRSAVGNNPSLLYLRSAVAAMTGCYYWLDIQEAVARSKAANAVLGRLSGCTTPTICPKNNILYIHIPRCGGMSVTKVLYGHVRDHHTAAFFRNVDRAFFSSAFKFALVRDPILRALSCYKYILNKGTPDMVLHTAWQIKTKHIKTLDHYIGFLEENSSRLSQLDYIMRPQVHFVLDVDGKLLVDKLFRLERDMGAVNSLFRSWGLSEVPHINATPVTDLQLNYRQVDRLSALYAADMRLYEGLDQEKPLL